MVRASGEPAPFVIVAPEHRRKVLIAAVLASAMGFIDSSVTAIALPAIRTTLGGTLAQAQWVSAAYFLTLSALILVGGALGDRFGVVRVFACGIVTFVAASLLVTVAQTMIQIDAARALQGLGAAFMVPGSMTLIARAHPVEERGRALGLWAASASATTAMGPILGGVLLTYGGPQVWRAIFALNLPLGLAALWLLWRYTRPDAGKVGASVDVVGAGLATAGLGLFAWALTGGAAGQLVGALVLLTLFLWWEARAKAPMIRLSLFRNRAFAAANLATLLLYIALTGVSFYLPMTVISAWHVTPIAVTAAFLPVSVLLALLSGWSGRQADSIGPGPLMTGGALLVGLGYGGIAMTAAPGAFWHFTVPLMGVVGLGLALLVAPLTAAVMANVPESDQGAASGINNAMARVAGLIAVSLMGRIAAWSYGTVSPTHPGFGLAGSDAGHIFASSAAFGLVAGLCALLAGASALVSWVGLRR